MAFTLAQRQLLDSRFSYNEPQHKALLEQKLTEFKTCSQELKNKVKPVYLSGLATAVTRFLGFYSFFMPIDLALFGYGVWELQNSLAANQRYRESLAELLEIYDWCIPQQGVLPPTNNAAIQGLIESMGSLINQERLQRLKPLANGQAETSGFTSYATAGGQAILGLFGVNASTPVNENILDQQTFTLLVRNLLNGKSISMLDYYCFGEGSQSLAGYLQYGRDMLSVANLSSEVVKAPQPTPSL